MTPPVRRAARRSAALLAPLAAAALALPMLVAAHADLVSSNPAQGAMVAPGSVGTISATFSEALADGSKLELVGPGGVDVTSGTISADKRSVTMPAPASMADGAWQLKWTSVGEDGDLLRGVIDFTVAAGASAGASAGTPATAAPAPSASGGASAGGGDVVLPVVVLIVVLVVGGAWFLRGRRGAA